jgi:hypothetical protein
MPEAKSSIKEPSNTSRLGAKRKGSGLIRIRRKTILQDSVNQEKSRLPVTREDFI